MTLVMGDGPVANLPPGLAAYAGYTNDSGIGETYPAIEVLAAAQKAIPFSITTNGSPAQCADVENGAMSDWTGYTWGYCSVSNVNSLIAKYGRPKVLWTAHQDPSIGKHICSPSCWPGLVTTADGTQWVDHNGLWDESVLSDTFFDPFQLPIGAIPMWGTSDKNGNDRLYYGTPNGTEGEADLVQATFDPPAPVGNNKGWEHVNLTKVAGLPPVAV